MKKYFKEAFAVFLIVIVTIVFSLNTNAETDTVKVTFADAYLTFEVWQGDGNTSISIGDDFLTKDRDIVKFEEFKEVQFKGEVFDDSNYFVTEEDNKTIITLKEEYLKTLKDGTYMFDAVFFRAIIPMKLHVVTHKISLTDAYFAFETWNGDGSAQVKLNPTTFSIEFYPELFVELLYKGVKVDSSNYSISKFGNVTNIILKEEYVKTLPEGEHYFTADFMNVNVKLKLRIEILKTTVPIKKPKQVKNVKVISNKKKIIIKWKKQKYITGYQVKIGRNNKITKNKKVITINKNKNKIVFKDLKANKKYFVKVRAYKVINGKKYWGVWSKRVSKKTL